MDFRPYGPLTSPSTLTEGKGVARGEQERSAKGLRRSFITWKSLENNGDDVQCNDENDDDYEMDNGDNKMMIMLI